MDLSESISDVGAAYLQDVRQIIPTSAVLISLLAIGLSINRSALDSIESGIWIHSFNLSIAQLLTGDMGIWKHIHTIDFPIALLCASIALICVEIFRKIVFWAITTSNEFITLTKPQKIEGNDASEPKLIWINSQIEKNRTKLQRKNILAELLSGASIASLFYGNVFSIVDFCVFLFGLTTSYICIQSTAKEYIRTIYPLQLYKARVAGIVSIDPQSH